MGNKVIALKDKSDGMIPIRIPVSVFVFFSRNAVNDQVSAVIAVQSPNDVQKSGLA